MPNLTLEIVEGPDAPRSLVLLPGSAQIGRDPAVDLPLRDDQVSRRHARLRTVDGEAEVEDLSSSNGTFVNGQRVSGPTRLRVGDVLMVGVSVLHLRTAAQVATGPVLTPLVPPPLARPARTPSYLDAPGGRGPALIHIDPRLEGLVDGRTKAKAMLAPLAVCLLAVLVVVTYLVTS